MAELSAAQSDGKLRATFFRSVTLVISASSLILAAAEGVFLPSGLTPFIALIAWIFVDHRRSLRIPAMVGNLLGLIALWMAANEFMGGTLLRKLLSGAHLVIYLSWIVLLLPKSHRQYWWLLALSVLELSIAGIVSGDAAFGTALMGMMLLLLWTMSVFSLYRVQDLHAASPGHHSQGNLSNNAGQDRQASTVRGEMKPSRLSRIRSSLRSFIGLRSVPSHGTMEATQSANRDDSQTPVIIVRNGLQRDADETWVGWRFRGMVSGSFVVSLFLAFIVFAAFPRVSIPGIMLGDVEAQQGSGGGRTGFSNSVALGDVGQIMQSNARVLTFDAVNLQTQKPMTAEELADGLNMDELRFRGNVFSRYYQGHWERGYSLRETTHEDGLHRPGNFSRMPSNFRVNIFQDPPFALFAFAPYPVSRIISPRGNRVVATEKRACLIWQDRPYEDRISRSFSVELPRVSAGDGIPFEYWNPSPNPQAGGPHSVHQSLRPSAEWLQSTAERLFLTDGVEMRNIARPRDMLIVEQRTYVREKDLPNAVPELYRIAGQICQDNGQRVPPDECVRRVLSYLSRENGFQYSLTPTRKVTTIDPLEDFLLNTKTGHCEYFASACTLMLQSVNVPARLVNGYYGCELNSMTGKYEVRQRHAHAWAEAWTNGKWQTLEATPIADRDASMPRSESTTLMANIQEAISDFWNDGIHNMSAQRQQEFFAPVISTSKSLYETIREQGLLATARQWISELAGSPEKWVSWQGGVVTFLLLAMIAGLIRAQAFQRLRRLVQSLWELRSPRHKSLKSVIRFYEGFCTLCERHGLKLSPSNSALENAQIATREFHAKISSTEILSLPVRIAEAFNQVRFGNQPLTDEQAAAISRDLQRFAELLK